MPSTDTGIPLARVVAVIATLADGREQIGSGFLVEGRRVLTAAHCTYDKKTGAAPYGLRVVRASDGAAAAVDDVVAAPGLDVAVLHLTAAPGEADLPAPVFARVARTHSGVLRDCAAIGFPLFQRDAAHSARHHAELHGTIYQTDEAEAGRLLMREPRLTHLEPSAPGDEGEGEPTDSVWGGLSGALVFHAGRAIGVIVEHHPRQGPSAVQLVAFDTLRQPAETGQEARQVADTLQLPPVEQLAVAAAEPVKPLPGLVDVIDEANGDLPKVRDLDPYRLGTTPSDYGTQDTYGEHDPYVPRTAQEADARLRAALESSRFVLLVGPAKVGKTRTAFEAIHAIWQDAYLAAPAPQQLANLADHPRLRGSSDPLVVWLDELERFLTISESLTLARLTALLARPGRTVVVATLRQEARHRLRAATGELTRDIRDVLTAAITITLHSTTEDPDEQAAAQAAYPDQPLDGAGLAERLGYAPELLMTYRDSGTADLVLHAVVRTAIDWARTGLPRPIAETDLLEIASSVLAEEHPGQQVPRKKITAAIKRARRPLGSGTGAALLLTESVSRPAGTSRSRGYRAYDYLIAADDGQTGPPRSVSEQSWLEALTRADDNEAFAVGVAAYQRGNRPVSIRGFEQAARAGSITAMLNLWVLLTAQDPPDLDGARPWLEKAARAGNTDAMSALGSLLVDRLDPPDLEGARHWYEEAARADHVKAMFNLGVLLANRLDPPDLDGARDWFEKAAQAGEPKAMAALGMLLMTRWEPPDLDGAHPWLEKAAHHGDTDAMFSLGVLLANRLDPSDLEGARHWLEKAARAGHTNAMVDLGVVLSDRWEPPDRDGARHWWAKAAQAGETMAMLNLGLLLEDLEPPDLEGARHWLEKAAQGGHTEAMAHLGEILADRWDPPDLDGARHWYERAAQAGHSTAMLNLGLLLAKGLDPPDLEGARHWWEKAAHLGDTTAMLNLGWLLAERSGPPDLEGARHWWEKAAPCGNTEAMARLGALLGDQEPPDLDGARHWLEKAAQAGNTSGMAGLGVLLAERSDPPDLDGARHWWERAARADHVKAMVKLGLLLADQEPPDLDGARHWLEKAAQASNTDAMGHLGVLLADRWDPPDLDGARHWYEEAAQAGHTGAMVRLGSLLAYRCQPPDFDGALRWWEEAAGAGESVAMVNLGMALAGWWDPPDLEGARDWWEKAAQAGHTGAMAALGVLLAGRWDPPDLDGACHWWEKAAQAGRSESAVDLGSVLAVEGDMAKARAYLQQAVQARHAGASEYAGALDDNPRIQDGARAALGKRADGGDTDALNFLGVLEWRAGNLDAARTAWTSSRDANNAVARILLRMTG